VGATALPGRCSLPRVGVFERRMVRRPTAETRAMRLGRTTPASSTQATG